MAHILIIDDDSGLREGLAEALGDLGHTATEAADGATGLRRLDERAFDAVLLDLRMPGMDGMTVLARIRERPAPPPVAVLTAVPTASNTIEAMRLGAVDHLAKPIGRADLVSLLERLLPRREGAGPAAAATEIGEELVPTVTEARHTSASDEWTGQPRFVPTGGDSRFNDSGY